MVVRRQVRLFISCRLAAASRAYTTDRLRPAYLSKVWTPTGGLTAASIEDGHGKLIRAGYLRQSYPGIFHFLPLGVRVLDKLKQVLVDEMNSLGASEVSLSSLTSEDLWRKSGRFANVASDVGCDQIRANG
jgi:prolyl-tRNA synthetase